MVQPDEEVRQIPAGVRDLIRRQTLREGVAPAELLGEHTVPPQVREVGGG